MNWKRLAFWGALTGGALALVIVSGIISIKASSGHWKVTRLLLHFTMQRSVATHATAVAPPPELDRRLTMMGAGHYEGGCRFCHGAPGDEMPEVARHMSPPPPWLPDHIGGYSDEELFYLVRHGVKFTGMPAWPAAERDDEVWAVVAFLREMSHLDEAGYRAWVVGDTEDAESDAPAVVLDVCARCHGIDGGGRGEGAFPRLAGQRPAYLYVSLEAYARGSRHSGIMQPIAVEMTPHQMRQASDWYASRPAPERREQGTPLGAKIAHEGISERKIPACAHCHGPDREPHHPAYPLLDGQYPPYLEQQLHLFLRRARGGATYAAIMRDVATHDLSPDEIAAVAAFYGAD